MSDTRPPPDSDKVVEAEIGRFLAATGRGAGKIDHGERLSESLGISSFDLAALVTSLNAKLSVDPFRTARAFTDLRTVEDLCRAYRPQPPGASASSGGDEALEASKRRAESRRASRRR